MPGASVLVVHAALNALGQGGEEKCQHFRMLLRIFLDVTQEPLNLHLGEVVREMWERARLPTALERPDIEENFLVVLREEIDERGRAFGCSPEGRKGIGRLDLECHHVSPTRDEMGKVRRRGIHG